MTLNESIIWFTIIFGADIIAMVLWERIKNRKRNKYLCDLCNEPARLKKVKHKSIWVCKECMELTRRTK